MEKRNTLIALVVILGISLIITLVGWIKTKTELVIAVNSNTELTQYSDSLTVCENIQTSDDENTCVKQLIELSKTLSKYQTMLKSIQIPVR